MDRARASRLVVVLSAFGLLFVSGGCASEFQQRYDTADRLRLEAAARGYEWIGTEDLLKQARVQQEQGDTDAALALVDKARSQAEVALQQADREEEAWKGRVVR